ncbi:undecaprenyl-diphosphate phosphatase [Qipengyuania zhejiangensis]|uniref:undecaprenyl-diphosphate phosphatase n=1 Tax=Qipengyuania zhejiangensis TaxID=3077782 RepID=UPI002D78588A|nr:undecaprenyl-diphosphate phosphatase [Qipengyuania sp. Z2]
MNDIFTAIFLGIVEGLTEFIPVSSTGHLILATELSGADPQEWAMFNVVIQLGAILAVVYQYWGTFWSAGMGVLKGEREGLMFARNILLGFLPSAVIGFTFYKNFEQMLGTPIIVPWALIVGGIAILVIERTANPHGEETVADLPLLKVLGVGFAQCLAMVPGVSRSGATIMGALAMGINRKTAAEFSFFLAVPTMIGASTLEIATKYESLMAGSTRVGWGEIAVGFVVSFIVALAVIRAFVAYVGRSGFAPFAWYRIVAGSAVLAYLTFG